MQFSFPLRVWRSTNRLAKDHRAKGADRGSLRSSRDVTFLRSVADAVEEDGEVDGIYAAQISCVVTGFDQDRWTALVLTETWFEEDKPDDPSPDKISRHENDYHDNLEGGFDAIFDPLCRGKIDVNQVWHPRPYFCRILETRVEQVHREWYQLVAKLRERHDSWVRLHTSMFSFNRLP